MNYIITLTIAGSDSSGGAGIQADIKTFSALGCYAASAVTAVTVQNTIGVEHVMEIPPHIVGGQIRAVMDDLQPRAAKVGMTTDSLTIKTIATELKYADFPIIVDPVMVATSGDRLMPADATDTLRNELIPLASLLTPNIPEAEALAGMTIKTAKDIDEAAHRLLDLGCKAVLMKGGHMEGNAKTDRLFAPGFQPEDFSGRTIYTDNTHGTGCTLSAAITAYMARGLPMSEAVGAARQYLQHALEAGASVNIGRGHGPVNHLYSPERMMIL
ncbi:MAG: bifunctional hydroxymethylpyrimidine kinase/phosphomethylpyrimidine kinase [Prevotella sp.]|uniref:bifunctional hydroxymethylpyrimidine kinase/phosphomethylpyrimidine kinase n=1 Tax=Prevotella sp. TaxID=59823 RepID=UPI002A314848|nr:bifunctional hydroxymethylpyrimidine kinase/phosphomethylpyrimidine kinase [Prevotella sp.]MDD7317249.1 bifunctional hydroxymethylpyrimidine kinase/phosphomethylpyrimidine kinase [Prevotellaceae bacterium]MDY4019853.1 bifunctional hydroxymethylpyrimidine kinase/phosphomethylpyrimidine kinase [Prevotella sp.]